MTNEEKAEELALNLFYDGIFYQDYESQKKEIQSAIMEMARWKDEQFKEMIQSLPKSVKDLIETLSR